MTRFEKLKADPVKYAEHKARAMEWSKRNPEKFAASQRKWRRKDEVRMRYNEKARERYATDLGKRMQMAWYSNKLRFTPQGRIASKIRSATFLLKNGNNGRNKKMFEEMSGKPGHYESLGGQHTDHIVPLVKFDLTDPIQLLKAVHWTNVRGCTADENMRKGDECALFEMDSLPYHNSEDALFFAGAFIRKCLQSLSKANTPLEDDYGNTGRRTVGDPGTPGGGLLGTETGQEALETTEPTVEHSSVPALQEAVSSEGEEVPTGIPEGLACS